MNRIVTARNGITLSTGHFLPHRTVIGWGHPFFPGSTSPSTSSNHPLLAPSQPPLEEFHPFRFAELRTQPGQENGNQFVTSDPNNINFGYGRNVCPGRFFASNEIKVILIEVLRRYDIGLGPNGEGAASGGGLYTRPEIQEFGPNFMPDTKAAVWMRERGGGGGLNGNGVNVVGKCENGRG